VSDLDVNAAVRTLGDAAELLGAGEYGGLERHQKILQKRIGDPRVREISSKASALSASEARSEAVVLIRGVTPSLVSLVVV
jgi:hypothetical protein